MHNKKASKGNTRTRVKYNVPWVVESVRALPRYRLQVRFVDGTAGEVDVSRLVLGARPGVFKALRDATVFNAARVCDGVVTWPGELDLAPDAMYDEIKANGHWVIPA